MLSKSRVKRTICLVLLLAIVSQVVSSPACCEPLPSNGEETLESILERPEFAANRDTPNFWEKFKKEMMSSAAAFLREKLEAISLPEIDLRRYPWLSKFLQALADIIASISTLVSGFLDVAPKLLFIFLLVFALLLGFDFLKKRKARYSLVKADSRMESTKRLDLSQLLAQHEYSLVLEELRRRHRELYARKFGISSSVSDRAALRSLPKEETSRGVFGNLVRTFEEVAFADACLEKDQVISLTEAAREAGTL